MLMGAELHPLQLIFRYSGRKQVTVAEWTFKEIYKHPQNKRSGDGSLDICLCQDLNPKGVRRDIFIMRNVKCPEIPQCGHNEDQAFWYSSS